MVKRYTPQEIRNLYDLVAAELRADLLSDEEFRAKQKALLDLAHESLRSRPVKFDESWFVPESEKGVA